MLHKDLTKTQISGETLSSHHTHMLFETKTIGGININSRAAVGCLPLNVAKIQS